MPRRSRPPSPRPYAEVFGREVPGDVEVLAGVASEELDRTLDVLVYRPPSYSRRSQRRYPVLYLHDAQNLFDPATSHAGAWEVGRRMDALALEGIEALVVGLPHAGRRRLVEYTPWRHGSLGGGGGQRHLAFVRDTLRPLVERCYRTLPGAENTGLGGSSLGGLVSLAGFLRHPEVFGLCAALSPSVWLGRRGLYELAESPPAPRGRLYLDVGAREVTDRRRGRRGRRLSSRRYVRMVRRLARRLQGRRGLDVRFVLDPEGRHDEASWGRRFPDAVRFLLEPAASRLPGS